MPDLPDVPDLPDNAADDLTLLALAADALAAVAPRAGGNAAGGGVAEVLAAALGLRAGGRYRGVEGDVAVISEAETYRRAQQEAARRFSALPAAAWATGGTPYGTVADLAGHCAAVEHHLGAVLGLWASAAESSVPHGSLLASPGADPAVVLADWFAWAALITSHLEGLDDAGLDRVVDFHHLRLAVRDVAVVRAFEVWTHTEDVGRALGLAPVDPDAGRLGRMTELALRLLPTVLDAAAVPAGPLRVVLTGPGGGTWPVRTARDPGAVAGATTVVVDRIAFCRRAAARVEVEGLAASVAGDADLAHAVLAATALLALD